MKSDESSIEKYEDTILYSLIAADISNRSLIRNLRAPLRVLWMGRIN